jgi:toxin-antitoxin system PIN domain toxin
VNLVDANVLLYAVNEDSPQHSRASTWLDQALDGAEAVGFAWIVLLAFLRLSTRADLFPRPLETSQALDVVETWLGARAAVVIHPTARHLAVLAGLLEPFGTAANLVNDAHLAALSVEHRGTVISFDHDFGRFPGVKWREPPPRG